MRGPLPGVLTYVFLISTMLSIGLTVTGAEILTAMRDRRMLGQALPAALTGLEIVLGIDNIIFISILAGKLPEHRQAGARTLGLALAMIMRILFLFFLTWIMGLTKPLFTVLANGISGRNLILIFGGIFLLGKSTSRFTIGWKGRRAGDPSLRPHPISGC